MTLVSLFLSFLKIGALGFGSGPAMLVLIEKELVGKGLMSQEHFTEAVAMGMSLPGPIATNMTLYCGYHVAGLPGALVSLVAMLIPGSLAILLLARGLTEIRGQAKLEAALRAMKPVVVAIFLFLAYNSSRSIRPHWDAVLIGVAALALLLFKVNPVWVILSALGIGLLFY